MTVPIEVINSDSYDIINQRTKEGPLSGKTTDIRLNILVFSGCLIGFVGWLLFVCFAGIGLVALPMDLILDYGYMPKPKSAKELATTKVILREQTRDMIREAEEIKKMQDALKFEEVEGWLSKKLEARKARNLFTKFQKRLYKLESVFNDITNISIVRCTD